MPNIIFTDDCGWADLGCYGITELDDLKSDIGERNDLSAKMPEKSAELTRLLHQWRDEMDAQMPTPNPNFQPPSPGSPPANDKKRAR